MTKIMQASASSVTQKEAKDKLARAIAAIVGLPAHTTRHSQLFLDRIQKYQKLSLLHRLKRWIPGTRDFKRRRQQSFLTATSNRAVLFGGLKSLTIEQKKSLLRKFLKVQHRLVPLELVESRVRAHFKGVTGVLSFSIIFIATPLFVWQWHHFNLYKPLAFLAYFVLVTVVMQLGTGSVHLLTSLTISPTTVKLLTIGLLFVWPGMVVVLSHRILDHLSHSNMYPFLHFGIVGAIYTVTLIWGLILVSVTIILSTLEILSSRKYRLHSEAVVIDRLFRVLFELDQNKSRDLGNHELKNTMIDLIETTAVAIETGMVRGSRTADPVTGVWFSDRMSQIAASVRELKKWVLTPKGDTRLHLQKRLAALFIQAIDGRWDEMPSQQDSLRRKSHLPAKLAALAVTLAVVAFLVFLAAQHWATPLNAYGFLTLIPWFLLIIFALFDPEKLKTLKDVIEVFSASKRL